MEVTPWTIHGHPIPVTAQQRLQRNIRYGRDGAEIRKGCDVPAQARLTHPLPCAVLGSSAQEGNYSIGKGPEEVTECCELLGLCEDLSWACPAWPRGKLGRIPSPSPLLLNIRTRELQPQFWWGRSRRNGGVFTATAFGSFQQ